MTHVRQSIRDDAVAAITGLTTTGANAFATRIKPTEQAKLPCWIVYTNAEEIERVSMDGLQQRSMQLLFEGVASDLSDIDDTLDTMLEELEEALTLTDLPEAKTLDLSEIEIEFSDEGDAPFGRISVLYVVTYHTNEGAPSVAL